MAMGVGGGAGGGVEGSGTNKSRRRGGSMRGGWRWQEVKTPRRVVAHARES
jgi:hypothetical protein